jgi:hypothetical protein
MRKRPFDNLSISIRYPLGAGHKEADGHAPLDGGFRQRKRVRSQAQSSVRPLDLHSASARPIAVALRELANLQEIRLAAVGARPFEDSPFNLSQGRERRIISAGLGPSELKFLVSVACSFSALNRPPAPVESDECVAVGVEINVGLIPLAGAGRQAGGQQAEKKGEAPKARRSFSSGFLVAVSNIPAESISWQSLHFCRRRNYDLEF